MIVLVISVLLSPASFSSETNTSIKDLRYGVALYQYYQNDYFSALTELAVARKKDGLVEHVENAELLVGGMSLSYGMDKRAISIFDRLLKEDVDPAVRNQVWFYLAKLLYQRKADDQARIYLNRIDEQLPAQFVDDFHYLEVLLSDGDRAVINSALEGMEERTLRSYTLYNRAMIERQHGLLPDALVSLQLASELSSDSEKEWGAESEESSKGHSQENKALLDRIHLATGYIALSQNNYPLAYSAFKKVRLHGPWAEQALLGYGWSAANNKDYALAIQAWNTLSQKPMLGPVVQETFVAIPHLYEKMGKTKEALNAFNVAAEHYEQLLTDLDEMGAQVQHQNMLKRWLQDDLGEGWLARNDDMQVNPQSRYLLHMLAQYQFQSSLKDLRDLQVLENNLLAWQHKIIAYRDMLATRTFAREQRITAIRQEPIEDLLKSVIPARDQLAEQILKAEQNNDPQVFANASEQAFYTIIREANAKTKAVTDKAERSEYEYKLKRLESLLFWQIAEQFPVRLWQAKSELNKLDDAIIEHQRRLKRLQSLMAVSNELDSLSGRVDAQHLRIEEQLTQVKQAINKANQGMQSLLLAELKNQSHQVRQYLAQSRLAIARIYDGYLQQAQGEQR